MEKTLQLFKTGKAQLNSILLGFSFLMILFSAQNSFGQTAGSYSFTATTATYGTLGSNNFAGLVATSDDDLSDAINIGFSFNFAGTNYTQFKASSNGFVTFNTSSTDANFLNSQANASISKPILMPLWDDLQSTARIRYLVDGTAPNRICKIDFRGNEWDYQAGGDVIKFQVWLYETSNRVEYRYQRSATAVNNGSATIGIYDANDTYLTLNGSGASPTASSTTFTSSISTKPANDQVYRFDPPTNPNITSSVASLTQFTACNSIPSASQSFTVSGALLTANILITAPTGFEVSTNNVNFFDTRTLTQTGGIVATTTIYARMKSLAVNPSAGNITIASTGATTKNISVSGVLLSPTGVSAGSDVTICNGSSTTLNATATAVPIAQVLSAINDNTGFATMTTNDTNRWGISASTNAGGVANELRMQYFSGTNPTPITAFVQSPLLNASNYTALSMTFKHNVDWFQGTIPLFMQTSPDGITWTTRWNLNATANVAANTVTVDLSALNNTSFYYRFLFDGNIFNIDFWYIDDIVVSGVFSSSTYSWTSSPAGFTSNLQNPTVSPTTTTTYTLAVTSNGCTVNDDVVVTVNPTTVGGSVAGGTTICSGSTSGILTLTGNTGAVVRWESSVSPFTVWSTIANTTATYTSGALTQTTQFRAVVQSGVCLEANSAATTVTVNPTSVGGSVNGGTTVCVGTTSGLLTLTGNTGNVVRWESSVAPFSTWTTIANTTSTYTSGALTQTTQFRAVVQSGVCPEANSTATTVSVETTTYTTALGWDNGTPNATKSAIISDNYTISTDFEACSLTINNNAVVTVISGNNVTLNGAITVSSGSFTLNNNANLLQLTDAVNSGNIRVRRNSSLIMRQDYTLWSSPVANQNLLAFSPNTLLTRFYTYNTSTNLYNAVPSPSTTSFDYGKGYLIRTPNNFPTTPTLWPGSFLGVPNNGPNSTALTNIGPGQRFNAIGNPYPSPIDMNEFVADNSTNITGTLYFWRKTNSIVTAPGYATWTAGTFVTNNEAQVFDPNDVIRTGQGFIVEATATGSSVVFNNGQRIADNANQFFKTSANRAIVERNRIWLNVTNTSGAFSQMAVGYITGATQGVDAFDGKYFNDGAISLNSFLNNEDYVIQGRALPFLNSDVVPLNFKTTLSGSFTISIDHVDGFFLGSQRIFLKDKTTNNVYDLKAGSYTFTSSIGTFNNRFEIVYINAAETDIQSAQCGSNLAAIDSYVYANLIAGAQGYRFRVTDLTTNQVQTIDKALRVFQLTQLTNYKFNTQYRIEVAVKLNNVWQPFGNSCTVTTPATTTQVRAIQCSSTLTAMSNVIYADNVPFATGYRFRVVNTLTSNAQVVDRTLREFRMNLLTSPEYNTLYTVEVAIRNTDGTYLPYGPICNLTTPEFPTTFLQNSQCDYTAVSNNETFYAVSYTGATTYRFRFINAALSYSYTFDKALRTFNLSEVPGLQPGTTYSVQVSIELNGEFGPYGKVCSLTTPGTVAITRTTEKVVPFTAVAYPNPYAESFNLNVTTSSDANISITVYDMIGKQIEVREVSASAINTIQIGDRYPSGVYNLIVTQDETSQNVRVIKR